MIRVILAGNPNCGKTTLFNALTGDNQRVGNWPGVTVEKKTGTFSLGEEIIEIIDLPGAYSLVSSIEASSQDEQVTARAVIDEQADMIINVIDACHLERHLYLTSQLLELGKPVIIGLNMMDIAMQRGIHIDTKALAQQLQCPVIELQAHRSLGVLQLQKTIAGKPEAAAILSLALAPSICCDLKNLEAHLSTSIGDPGLTRYIARRVLEGDTFLDIPLVNHYVTPDADVAMADARYYAIHQIVTRVQKKHSDASHHFTAKLDRIILHRFWALPIFFVMMYCMFLFAINIGGAFQDFFNITTDAIFVQGTAFLLQKIHAPDWVIALFANGIGKGINTTLTFIPVMASMFFFLSLLETSGYMARAAFAVDKVMRILGLPGKSFVPMIVGFGCNVPAIMAARTLDSERDRLLTVMMSPFMSCSARLAIYAVFVAAFFPTGGQNIVFSLYLIGILMAVITGFFLRKTLLRGQAAPLIIELPAYHKPNLRRLLKETSFRLRYFIARAAKLIIPVCIILGGLNALTIHGALHAGEATSSDSLLSWLGQCLTPLFSPMGVHLDNWPATVGLLTGMLAKEVVIGTLNSLYSQMNGIISHALTFDLIGSLQEAVASIPQNLLHLKEALFNPIWATAHSDELTQPVYGIMSHYFDGKAGAYAYLLFILLYIPCISTMAAIRQESNRKWMWFSIVWSFIAAYSVAVLFYQAATFMLHPLQTITWFVSILLLLISVFFILRATVKIPYGGHYAVANS